MVLLALLSVLFPLLGDSSAIGSGAAGESAAARNANKVASARAGAQGGSALDDCNRKPHLRAPMSCIDSFWDPLRHLLDRPKTEIAPATTAAPDAAKECKAGCTVVCSPPDKSPSYGCLDAGPDLGSLQIRPVILLVPEPSVTDLKYEFDRSIDAVSQAIEAADYTRDRFYLPWELAQGGDDARCSEKVPGLLLFRNLNSHPATSDADDVVAVLVVGETPTWGVDHQVARAALDVAAQLSATRWTKTPAARDLSILGPFHSGSSDSLRHVLDTFASADGDATPPLQIHVVTGTASGADVGHDLGTVSKGLPLVDFRRTTLPDDVLLDNFYGYLVDALGVEQRNDVLVGVAMMAEAGTAYGRLTQVPLPTDSKKNARAPRGPEIRIDFPLHIATIRAGNDALGSPAAAGTSSPLGISVAPSILAPNFARDDNRQDTPRLLSTEAAASDDLVLTSELAQLSEQRVTHVGIVASDTADTVFLADRVRRRVPNARLFFLYSEALLTHPAFFHALYGAMMISPYPMFLPADRWVAPFQEGPTNNIDAFSGSLSAGVYNAMLTLLDKQDRMRGYLAPFETGQQRSVVPPVWISVVGGSGASPLAALRVDKGVEDVVHAPLPAHPTSVVRTPRAWHRVVGAVLLVTAFLTIGVGKAARGDTESPMFRGFTVFALKSESSLARFIAATLALACVLFMVVLVGSLASVPLFAPHLGPHHEIVFDSISRWLALVYFFLSGIIALCLLGGWYQLAQGQQTSSNRRTLVSIGVMMMVILGTSVAIACLAAGRHFLQAPVRDPLLFYVRATDIAAMVTPVTPALIAVWAVFLLTTAYLGRHRLSASAIFDAFQEPQDGEPAAPEQDERLGAAIREVREAMVEPWRDGARPRVWLVVTAIIIGLLPSWFLFDSPLSAIDRGRLVFTWIIVLSCVLFCSSVTWLLFLRASLFRLLKLLNHHPIRNALSLLPASVGATPTTSVTLFGDQARALRDRNGEVALLGNAVVKSSDDLVQWATSSGHTTMSERALALKLAKKSDGDPLRHFAAFFREVDGLLWSIWALPVQERPRRDRPVKPNKDPKPGQAWYWTAQEFVGCYLALIVRAAVAALANLLAATVASLLLMVLALECYPLEPSSLLRTLCWAGVVLLALTSVVTLFRLEKDEAISRIQKTDPGKINWTPDFIAHLLLWIILPFVGFLATQYPDAVRHLVTWVKPVAAIH